MTEETHILAFLSGLDTALKEAEHTYLNLIELVEEYPHKSTFRRSCTDAWGHYKDLITVSINLSRVEDYKDVIDPASFPHIAAAAEKGAAWK